MQRVNESLLPILASNDQYSSSSGFQGLGFRVFNRIVVNLSNFIKTSTGLKNKNWVKHGFLSLL